MSAWCERTRFQVRGSGEPLGGGGQVDHVFSVAIECEGIGAMGLPVRGGGVSLVGGERVRGRIGDRKLDRLQKLRSRTQNLVRK